MESLRPEDDPTSCRTGSGLWTRRRSRVLSTDTVISSGTDEVFEGIVMSPSPSHGSRNTSTPDGLTSTITSATFRQQVCASSPTSGDRVAQLGGDDDGARSSTDAGDVSRSSTDSALSEVYCPALVDGFVLPSEKQKRKCLHCSLISIIEPDRPVSSSVNSILLRRHSSWDVCSLSSSVSSICSLASSMTGSSLPADDMDFLLESLRAVFTCRGRSTSQAAWEHCGHARCRAWRSVLDHELQCLLLQHSGSGCRAVRELHEVGHQHARQCEEAYCPVTFCRRIKCQIAEAEMVERRRNFHRDSRRSRPSQGVNTEQLFDQISRWYGRQDEPDDEVRTRGLQPGPGEDWVRGGTPGDSDDEVSRESRHPTHLLLRPDSNASASVADTPLETPQAPNQRDVLVGEQCSSLPLTSLSSLCQQQASLATPVIPTSTSSTPTPHASSPHTIGYSASPPLVRGQVSRDSTGSQVSTASVSTTVPSHDFGFDRVQSMYEDMPEADPDILQKQHSEPVAVTANSVTFAPSPPTFRSKTGEGGTSLTRHGSLKVRQRENFTRSTRNRKSCPAFNLEDLKDIHEDIRLRNQSRPVSFSRGSSFRASHRADSFSSIPEDAQALQRMEMLERSRMATSSVHFRPEVYDMENRKQAIPLKRDGDAASSSFSLSSGRNLKRLFNGRSSTSHSLAGSVASSRSLSLRSSANSEMFREISNSDLSSSYTTSGRSSAVLSRRDSMSPTGLASSFDSFSIRSSRTSSITSWHSSLGSYEDSYAGCNEIFPASLEILYPYNKERLPTSAEGTCNEESDWARVCQIGKGSYGRCLLCRPRSRGREVAADKHFVVKVVSNTPDVPNEISCWSRLNHPNILSLYGAARHDDLVLMYTEMMLGGSVAECLMDTKHQPLALDEATALSYIEQVLCGIEAMHDTYILHRDIKGSNILLNDGRHIAKVADFGTALDIGGDSSDGHEGSVKRSGSFKGVIGSQPWLAPEVARSELGSDSYPRDIWACGCFLYEMLTARVPWADQQGSLVYLIGRCRDRSNVPALPETVGEFTKEIYDSMTELDPEVRSSASQLVEKCKDHRRRTVPRNQVSSVGNSIGRLPKEGGAVHPRPATKTMDETSPSRALSYLSEDRAMDVHVALGGITADPRITTASSTSSGIDIASDFSQADVVMDDLEPPLDQGHPASFVIDQQNRSNADRDDLSTTGSSASNLDNEHGSASPRRSSATSPHLRPRAGAVVKRTSPTSPSPQHRATPPIQTAAPRSANLGPASGHANADEQQSDADMDTVHSLGSSWEFVGSETSITEPIYGTQDLPFASIDIRSVLSSRSTTSMESIINSKHALAQLSMISAMRSADTPLSSSHPSFYATHPDVFLPFDVSASPNVLSPTARTRPIAIARPARSDHDDMLQSPAKRSVTSGDFTASFLSSSGLPIFPYESSPASGNRGLADNMYSGPQVQYNTANMGDTRKTGVFRAQYSDSPPPGPSTEQRRHQQTYPDRPPSRLIDPSRNVDVGREKSTVLGGDPTAGATLPSHEAARYDTSQGQLHQSMETVPAYPYTPSPSEQDDVVNKPAASNQRGFVGDRPESVPNPQSEPYSAGTRTTAVFDAGVRLRSNISTSAAYDPSARSEVLLSNPLVLSPSSEQAPFLPNSSVNAAPTTRDLTSNNPSGPHPGQAAPSASRVQGILIYEEQCLPSNDVTPTTPKITSPGTPGLGVIAPGPTGPRVDDGGSPREGPGIPRAGQSSPGESRHRKHSGKNSVSSSLLQQQQLHPNDQGHSCSVEEPMDMAVERQHGQHPSPQQHQWRKSMNNSSAGSGVEQVHHSGHASPSGSRPSTASHQSPPLGTGRTACSPRGRNPSGSLRDRPFAPAERTQSGDQLGRANGPHSGPHVLIGRGYADGGQVSPEVVQHQQQNHNGVPGAALTSQHQHAGRGQAPEPRQHQHQQQNWQHNRQGQAQHGPMHQPLQPQHQHYLVEQAPSHPYTAPGGNLPQGPHPDEFAASPHQQRQPNHAERDPPKTSTPPAFQRRFCHTPPAEPPVSYQNPAGHQQAKSSSSPHSQHKQRTVNAAELHFPQGQHDHAYHQNPVHSQDPSHFQQELYHPNQQQQPVPPYQHQQQQQVPPYQHQYHQQQHQQHQQHRHYNLPPQQYQEQQQFARQLPHHNYQRQHPEERAHYNTHHPPVDQAVQSSRPHAQGPYSTHAPNYDSAHARNGGDMDGGGWEGGVGNESQPHYRRREVYTEPLRSLSPGGSMFYLNPAGEANAAGGASQYRQTSSSALIGRVGLGDHGGQHSDELSGFEFTSSATSLDKMDVQHDDVGAFVFGSPSTTAATNSTQLKASIYMFGPNGAAPYQKVLEVYVERQWTIKKLIYNISKEICERMGVVSFGLLAMPEHQPGDLQMISQHELRQTRRGELVLQTCPSLSLCIEPTNTRQG